MRGLLMVAGVAAGLMAAAPATASTYGTVQKTCPVGGEKFSATELMSISTWGRLPDGMPLGSGEFPIQLTQCPGNGLVMYRTFTPDDVARLKPLIADPAYQGLRKTETRYYLAYWLATRLGDDNAPWLLLSATWQAKNIDPAGELARRYNSEFVALVAKLPVSDTDFVSIALRARAVNALRELGRFDDADALGKSIKIADTAGGTDDNAAANRKGWSEYLAGLSLVIARRDAARAPLELIGRREAAMRCLEPERAKKEGGSATPLTESEAKYCASAEMAPEIANWRKTLNL